MVISVLLVYLKLAVAAVDPISKGMAGYAGSTL